MKKAVLHNLKVILFLKFCLKYKKFRKKAMTGRYWFVLILSAVVAYMVRDVVHEGNIGIYFRGSAILKGVYEPGLYFKIPFITSMI